MAVRLCLEGREPVRAGGFDTRRRILMVLLMAAAMQAGGCARADEKLSQWVRHVLARHDFRPVWSPTRALSLGGERWVWGLIWPADGVVAISRWPSEELCKQYHFTQVLVTGDQTSLGECRAAVFHVYSQDITNCDGLLLCGFFDPDMPVPMGVLNLRQGAPPTEVPRDADSFDALRWWTVDNERGSDALWRDGPLELWSGRGRLVARGTLPPGVLVAHCEVRPTWMTDTAAVGVFGSIPSSKWIAEEVIYSDLSVISVPLAPGGEARVLRQFSPPSDQELPEPARDHPAGFTVRSIDGAAADEKGSRIAFWEWLSFECPGGNTIIHRLWVWDEEAQRRRVAASFADCDVDDGSYWIEVNPDGHMHKTPQRYESWGNYPRCALSPDGKWLAYNIGEELRFVDLTKPLIAD